MTSKDVLVETFEEGILMMDSMDEDVKQRHKLALLGLNAILKMVFEDNFIHADLHPGNIIVRSKSNEVDGCVEKQLCLIDAGIVAELSADDRRNFIDLFRAVVLNDGVTVGQLMIERSRHGTCIDREGFMNSMKTVVSEVNASGLSLGRMGISSLLQRVLALCYVHQVKLESRYASVIIAIGILEGLGRRLDPDIDILQIAMPYILKAYVNS